MSFQPNFLARAPALQSVAFSSHMLHSASICNFYRQWRPGILVEKVLRHFRKKSFHPNFLAQAPALQSVAFRRSTGRPQISFFTTISFWPKFFNQIFWPRFFDLNIFIKKNFLDHGTSKPNIPIVPNQKCQTKPNLPNQTDQTKRTKPNPPNQTYQTKPNKPNIPNQTYQTKPIKPNLPDQTYQAKPIKPNLPNQTYKTKHTKPNQTYQTKPTKPNLANQTYQTKPSKSNLPNQTYLTKPIQTILVNQIKTRN